MISARNMAAALIAGAPILCAVHAAAAEESGTFRIIRTYVQDYTSIDLAGERITGGTGAYESISGSCTYDVDYLPDDWLVMIADCTWQR